MTDPTPASLVSFAEALNALAQQIRTDEALQAFDSAIRFVEASKVPVVVSRPSSGTSSVGGGGGLISQSQFAALNQCEASGGNGWRTGRYGLETGTGDVGSWTLEQQQAKAQQVFNDFGASAWGVSCRGILGG